MNQRGLGMVEIIVVVAVVITTFTAILQLFKLQLESERAKRDELRAYALLAEEMEAVRAVRDEAWSNLTSHIGGDHYLVLSGGRWIIQDSPDPGPTDGFTRWAVLSSVRRDGNDDIVPSGGTVDSGTLLVTGYVEWQSGGATKTRSVAIYLTDRL